MSTHTPPGLFITGTDTGVGKTFVAALVARQLVGEGLRVGVYKPAASGCARDADGNLTSDDARMLWEAANRPGELERVCPQRFAAPLAPDLAARAEDRAIDARLLVDGLAYWKQRSDVLVVEGAGGLFSPLEEERLNVEWARELGYPLVVVAPNRLGTIHGVLSTVVASRERAPNLPIAAVVLNEATSDPSDPSRASNAVEIRKRLPEFGVQELTELAYGATSFALPVDWLRCAVSKKP